MNSTRNPRLLAFEGRTGGWLQRAMFATLGLLVLVAGFFFLTVALVAGAILALVIAIRVWWVMRRLRAQARAASPLEGEYTVVDRTEDHSRRR